MGKLKDVWSNKWVKFSVVSIIYILLCVVWTGNLWMLLGLLVIYDIYISKFMYRLFWRRHKEKKGKSKAYKKVSEWVEAIVFAVIAVTLLRYFVFGMYVIPTPSMEKSLLVGDYLLVSKLAYGPAVPNTPLAFPLVHNTMPLSQTKKSYSEAVKWPYHRLKGFGHVKRGDVVVFNFPAGDTVLLEKQNVTYYDVLRAYRAQYGQEEGYSRLHKDYTVISRPVDRRENYVKRCVGVAGDSVEVKGSLLLVNGQSLGEIPGVQYIYRIQTNGTAISRQRMDEMGISEEDSRGFDPVEKVYMMPLTRENAEKIGKMSNIVSITQYPMTYAERDIFPHDSRYPWSQDNYGPIWVPKKGVTVSLDDSTIPFYRDIIGKYEGNELEEREGRIYINGSVADSYTFKMDYFFMMGDNRHRSADSRYWGFVPEDHIVGKASFVWLSLNSDKSFPSNIRWGRMFRKIR